MKTWRHWAWPFQARLNVWHVLGAGGAVCLWIALSRFVGEARLPSLMSVAVAIRDSISYSSLLAARVTHHPNILFDLQYTAVRAIEGIVVGSAIGVLWGLAAFVSPRAGRVTAVPIEILRILPPLVVIPFFLMWLGPSSETQFFVISVYAFVRIVVLTSEAARNIQPVMVEFCLTMGATQAQALRTVVLPAIVPEIVGGLRVVLAEAWGLQIVAELLGSEAGVGQVLGYLLPTLRVDYMIATTFWLTLIAVLVDVFVFVPVTTRLTRWLPRSVA